VFLFEKLDVYQNSLVFAKEVIQASNRFSRGNYAIADQLRRASLSIPLNIAEGNGRWHSKDRKSFFLIARGSAFECVPLIEICRDLGLVEPKQAEEWRDNIKEIGRMLNGLIKSIDTSKIEIRPIRYSFATLISTIEYLISASLKMPGIF
jgi:four helix bundle protein